jgi:hypothetical protein
MSFDAVVIGGGGCQVGLPLAIMLSSRGLNTDIGPTSNLGHPKTDFQLTQEEAFANEKHD